MEKKIEEGVPPKAGMYVAYVNGDLPGLRWADKVLLMWSRESGWGYRMSDQRYRGHVYGWIGPLPALELTDEPPSQSEA